VSSQSDRDEVLYSTLIPSPLGDMLAVADDEAIQGLWFLEEGRLPRDMAKLAETLSPKGRLPPVMGVLRSWLRDYFARKNPPISFMKIMGGTDFQIRVWNEIDKIPYGETITYGEIAEAVVKDDSQSPGARTKLPYQAVGSAVGRNPISIVVPCHRVMGAGGKLTGYGGGLDRKRYLLELECPGATKDFT